MSRWLFFPFLDAFIPDGEFAYCAFSESQLATFRPVVFFLDGTLFTALLTLITQDLIEAYESTIDKQR